MIYNGWNSVPPKTHVHRLMSPYFEIGSLEIQPSWVHIGLWWVLKSMTSVFLWEIQLQTHTWESPCKGKGRNQVMQPSQGVLSIAGSHPKPGRGNEGSSLETSEGARPCLHWFWTSSLQNCKKINFCCFLLSGF